MTAALPPASVDATPGPLAEAGFVGVRPRATLVRLFTNGLGRAVASPAVVAHWSGAGRPTGG